MSKVSTWSTTAGSNNSSPPDGWPEGMQRSAVNDAAREMMASLAKWYQDSRVGIVTTGGTTAYLLTTNCVHAALANIPMLAFRVNVANTGAVTLAVDGLTAKSVVKAGGSALASGDWSANQAVVVVYNSNLDRFEMIGPQASVAAATLLTALLTVDGAGSGLDADLLDGNSSAAFAKIANNLSDLASAVTAFTNIKQAASTTATGVAELAIASEMVTGTDAARVPSVSVLHNHEGVAKAWGAVTSAGSLSDSYGVSGVVRNSTGTYTVTMSATMANATYAAVTSAYNNSDAIATSDAKTTTTFQVRTTDSFSSADVDFHFAVFGTLA